MLRGRRYSLVMRAGARVVGDFPPSQGFGVWTRDAIAVTIGSLFEAKPHPLTKALDAQVADDGAIEAFLLAALKRHLIDEAKKTDVGKMCRPVRECLRQGFAGCSVDCPGEVVGAGGVCQACVVGRLGCPHRTPRTVRQRILATVATVATTVAYDTY